MKMWAYACLCCVLLVVHTALAGAGTVAAADRNRRCDDVFQTAGTGKNRGPGDDQFSVASGGSASWRASPQHPSAIRVGVWGDSHTASGSFVDAMLQAWGFPADGTRAGYVQAAIGLPGVRLGIARTCLTKQWNLNFAYRSPVRETGFTSTLVNLKSDANDEMVVLDFVGADGAPPPQWLNIHLDKPDPDATLILGMSINGGAEASPTVLDGGIHTLQITPDTEIRTLRLRLIAGQLGLTGFEPVYRSTPKLIIDIFSTPGAQSKAWLNQKIKPIDAHYDMVIFQYGTNEAPSDSYRPDQYAVSLRKELRQFRAIHPTSRCVVMGPPDRVGMTQADKKMDYPARHQSISKVQALVSPEFRCEYWDWQRAMGGPKSVLDWAKRAEPLAQADLMHLTSQGYAESARLFAASIRRPALLAK
jgi:lysophospholipase L1-like esterase